MHFRLSETISPGCTKQNPPPRVSSLNHDGGFCLLQSGFCPPAGQYVLYTPTTVYRIIGKLYCPWDLSRCISEAISNHHHDLVQSLSKWLLLKCSLCWSWRASPLEMASLLAWICMFCHLSRVGIAQEDQNIKKRDCKVFQEALGSGNGYSHFQQTISEGNKTWYINT